MDMALVKLSYTLTDLCTRRDELLDCVSHSRKMDRLCTSNPVHERVFLSHVAPCHVIVTGVCRRTRRYCLG